MPILCIGRTVAQSRIGAVCVFNSPFDRPTLMGPATPNFGQAGGGVEVLFNAGATNRPGVSFMINVG